MKASVLLAAATRVTRRALNARYRRMSPAQRVRFYSSYAKIFREVRLPVQRGDWVVDFLGRAVRVPLVCDRMWLDWDMAVSIVGHDSDVTRTYESLLQSSARPDLFFDVGANYGTPCGPAGLAGDPGGGL